MESVSGNRSAVTIARLKNELSKAVESEKALRSQNAELIRTKAIVESQSTDLSRKLEAAQQCIADYESKMTKLTAKNTELQTQCIKVGSEMDEVRSNNEKSMNDQFERNSHGKSKFPSKRCDLNNLDENLDSNLGKLMVSKIRHYEADVIKREKILSMEKELLRTELKNGIDELRSKFEKCRKKQDDYMYRLDAECSTRTASILGEKRRMETKLTAMEKEMRFINEVLKYNKIDKTIFVEGNRTPRSDDGRHVNLKAIAARYHRT